MEIDDDRYNAVETAYAKSASAVQWAYLHWALDDGIESALKDVMGDGVAEAVVDLLKAVEALLRDGRWLPKTKLALTANDPFTDEEIS